MDRLKRMFEREEVKEKRKSLDARYPNDPIKKAVYLTASLIGRGRESDSYEKTANEVISHANRLKAKLKGAPASNLLGKTTSAQWLSLNRHKVVTDVYTAMDIIHDDLEKE